MVKTDIHYPTDINLLFDAIRCLIRNIAHACKKSGRTEFRQWKHNIRKIKRLLMKCQNTKRSTSKKEEKKALREKLIRKTHREYIFEIKKILKNVEAIIPFLNENNLIMEVLLIKVHNCIRHVKRQIDQIDRRVIKQEVIPHNEKVFSIFEEHTEWICKGKAGVPVELGLRVCVIRDQYGFILHHKVMEKITDDKIAVPIIMETKERYPDFNSCSFDKGFYTRENKEKLSKILTKVILPKKGKLSEKDKEIEYTEDFKKERRQHSAVESSISVLDNHGLDICPDHDLKGFKRYVGLGILGRNFQILGNYIQQKRLRQLQRQERKKRLA